MCSTHYRRWQRHGDPNHRDERYNPEPRHCTATGCDRLHYARGWCKLHYTRWKANGTPYHRSPEERFWCLVNKDGPIPDYRPDLGPCWTWRGYTRKGGYASFFLASTTFIGSHVFAYQLLVGPVPRGLELDHLCRVPSCVRPTHLEPVTRRENIRRAVAARRLKGSIPQR